MTKLVSQFAITQKPKMQVNSNINWKKNYSQNILTCTSSFNLIFHSYDNMWQLKIQNILGSKGNRFLAGIAVKSKILHYRIDLHVDIHKIHLHATHLTFRSQVIIWKPKFYKYKKGHNSGKHCKINRHYRNWPRY